MGRTQQVPSRSMLTLVRPSSLASRRINSIPITIAQPGLSFLRSTQIRFFETEAEFHTVADETLETIQDAVDEMLESEKGIDYEVNLASGVLTLKMQPHGTWVLNKQTPNRQIWWSSPLSGPKRFEFDSKDNLWFSTKDGLNLGRTLMQEIHHVYPDIKESDLEL